MMVGRSQGNNDCNALRKVASAIFALFNCLSMVLGTQKKMLNLLCSCFLLFWYKTHSAWPETYCVVNAGLDFVVLLLLAPECQDSGPTTLSLIFYLFSRKRSNVFFSFSLYFSLLATVYIHLDCDNVINAKTLLGVQSIFTIK